MNDPLVLKFVDIVAACNHLGIATELDEPYGEARRLVVDHSQTPLWHIFEFYVLPAGADRSAAYKTCSVRYSGYNITVDCYPGDSNLREVIKAAGEHYLEDIRQWTVAMVTDLQRSFELKLSRAA
jgi:hypothetical protein